MTASNEQLLRASVRGVLAGASDHDSVATALAEQGWAEIAAAEGDAAWRVLFREVAAALTPVHPLDLFLEALFEPSPGGSPARLAYVTERTPAEQAVDQRLGRPPHPRGVTRAGRAVPHDYVVLTARRGAAVSIGRIDAVDVSVEPVSGYDPDYDLRRIQLLAAPRPLDVDVDVTAGIDRAHVLQAHALAELSERMLAIAKEHVTTRHQFGRPVGSFQAVKHLLADCAVELESLRAVLEYAGESLDPVAVTAARALAGRTALTVGRATQQTCGAMGFSSEFPLHRFIRRAHSYDVMLGPATLHTHNLGQFVLDHGAVPHVGEA